LPDRLYGNPWYLYVDSGIQESQLFDLIKVIEDAIESIKNIVLPQETQSLSTNESSVHSIVSMSTTPEQQDLIIK
jgi:hypothetical protein